MKVAPLKKIKETEQPKFSAKFLKDLTNDIILRRKTKFIDMKKNIKKIVKLG